MLNSILFVLQGERRIRSASPIKGVPSSQSPALPRCPLSAPVQAKSTSSSSPKTIFPYPSHQNSPPKSPRRLSFTGIFRSSSSSSPTSIKIFSRTRRGKSTGQCCTDCPFTKQTLRFLMLKTCEGSCWLQGGNVTQ